MGGGMDLDARTLEIGRELLAEVRRRRGELFSRRFWSDRFMQRAMQDDAFKVQLFRCVDAFPALRSPEAVYDCLVEYLTQPGVTLPPGMEIGLKAGGLAKGMLTKTIGRWIAAIAANFIAGSDAASALPKLRQRWGQGVAFTADLLGEACVSPKEAEVYQRRYLDLVRALPPAVRLWPPNPALESDHLGPVPRVNLSVKVSSLDARPDPIDSDGALRRLTESLRPILEEAAHNGVFVNFDMEQYALKDLTIELFQRCCRAVDFPAGIALQAYLQSGEEDAARILSWAKGLGRQVTVRLIKGAYWDYEAIRAEQLGWRVPVWTQKQQTDACFERMAEMFIAATPRRAGEGGVKLAIGSHNVRSIARALALAQKYDLPPPSVEFQMLFGMADALKPVLTARGLRLREYAPLGEMIPGMAYLVRRLLENTSNESWLRAGFFEHASDEALLASPHVAEVRQPAAAAIPSGATAGLSSGGAPPLRSFESPLNEPARDFSQAAVRERFAQAIAAAVVPAVANDASAEAAGEVVRRAVAALPAWRGEPWRRRADVLVEAARRMRARRDELAGVMIREAGKTWREADADVCEAIDYCEFYARRAADLFAPRRLGRFVGEQNDLWHEARGVAVVISPWNFPLAICTGMTTAALVTGNPTIVKPSSQTVGIARLMCEILWQAGAPADVLQLIAGPGALVGAVLVRHADTSLIAFTGSKEVGLEILAAAGRTSEGQRSLKKVICEMGGKNAIIVDESADLDEAVLAVRHSAFSYSGQKCSACSRAIVVEAAYDAFLARLIDSTRGLTIGDPLEPGTDVGPVIDAAAAAKIRRYIDIGAGEGKLELACEVPPGLEERTGRHYVGPHIFSGIRAEHRLANEEVFGPVLSIMRAADFAEALAIANGTAYKLTGGVFSRKPSHLELARREFRVGNLYLNRGITGALAGRQPFGGFGLSGGGTKAGGDEYLLHFVQPRSCCENTMRRGFAPGLTSR